MIRALLVDDEAPARSELRFLLDEAGGVQVVDEASSAVEVLRLVKTVSYDAIFLDIDMPGLNGVQLADVLTNLEKAPAIIFVTAHGEHAVKAFEVAATDYLVKPVEIARLRQAIGRVADTELSTRVERIPVEKAGRKILLDVEAIFYVMAKDDYSYLFTDAERYLSTISLAQLETRLESRGFFRVHRRFLVNLAEVKEVVPMYGGTLLLTLKDTAATQVPVSRRRVPALKRALGL